MRVELDRLQKNTKVVHMMQLQTECASLRDENTKLKLKWDLLTKRHVTETAQFDNIYEHEALSYMAADRIDKLAVISKLFRRKIVS
jgi:hypothetical protein